MSSNLAKTIFERQNYEPKCPGWIRLRLLLGALGVSRPDNRLVKGLLFPPRLPQGQDAFAADALLLTGTEDARLGLQPHADMRRKRRCAISTSAPSAVTRPPGSSGTSSQAARSGCRSIDPAPIALRGRPARNTRQQAAEQLALHMTGEIPTIAQLPGPGLPDQRGRKATRSVMSATGLGIECNHNFCSASETACSAGSPCAASFMAASSASESEMGIGSLRSLEVRALVLDPVARSDGVRPHLLTPHRCIRNASSALSRLPPAEFAATHWSRPRRRGRELGAPGAATSRAFAASSRNLRPLPVAVSKAARS